MFDENKENNSAFCTPINLKAISSRKPISSKRFTPYKTPNSQRFARILDQPREFKSQHVFKDILKDPELNITPLTPPDSPERVKLSSQRSPLISTRIATELTSISSDISYVVGKTWRLHQCSPLFNFQTSSLETYKKSLLAHLQTTVRSRGFAYEVQDDEYGGNCEFSVDFLRLDEFSFYSSDEEAIRVAVYQRRKQHMPSVADVIFCNFGSEWQDFYPKEFTHLPLCLVKGPVGLTRDVISWFQSQFDCVITPLKLPPLELSWFGSLWAGIQPQKNTASSFELFYTLPSKVKGLRKLVLNFDSGDIKLLWDCCHSDDSNIFTGKQSELFMEALNSHFYSHFKVRLDSLSLSRICTSIVYLSNEGQLKILQEKYVRHVLQQITVSVMEMQQNGRL